MATLAALWLIREHAPRIDLQLARFDVAFAIGESNFLPVPGGYLLPALSMGLLSRMFSLHRQLSSWLAIRERFDVEVIIGQLAQQTGIDLRHVADAALVERRHEIMRRAFYPFTSGTHPAIDADLVHQALDAWSWFWAGFEAAMVFVAAGMTQVASGALAIGVATLSSSLALAALGLPALRRECRRYAIAQVRAICSDPAREAAVCQAFACFQEGTIPRRRIA